MQSASPAAWGLIVCFSVVGAFTALRSNLFRGIGVTLICVFLIPTWNTVSAFYVEFDFRILVAIVAAVAVLLLRPRWLFDRLLFADICVAFLCLLQTFSEWSANGISSTPLALSYGYWVLPYIAGRCSARSLSDLKCLGFLLNTLCVIFSLACLLEISTGIDLFEFVFRSKPGTQFHMVKGSRWGYVRCEGPYTHPIFFSTVVMLGLPWLAWLSKCCKGSTRLAAIGGALCCIVAAVSSFSRGPVLGILLSLVFSALTKFRKTLFASITIIAFAALFFVIRPDYFEDATLWFSRLSGERERAALIDEKEQVWTSSMSRVLIVQHYWKSVRHAGLIGYGMTATDGFPPNVPHVPYDEATGKQFPIVDNTYILLALRGGWLLSLGFVLLMITAMLQFHNLEKQEPELKVLCRMMIGAICAFALVVFTVYPDVDFMFVFLWTVGISSVRLDADPL